MERFILCLIVCILCFGHQVKAVNECSSNPCMNGATCVDYGNYGYYTCLCVTNWMGTNCEIVAEGANCGMNHYSSTGTISSPDYPDGYPNYTHCLYLVRVHGATKIELHFETFRTQYNEDFVLIGTGPVASSTSLEHHYKIEYSYSWSVTYTTNKIWMEFISDHRHSRTGWNITYIADFSGCLCFNGGTCTNSHTKQCSCPDGWDGTHCEHDINECASMPCLNGGTCYDYTNFYSCNCASEFHGTNCELEIPKCLINQCNYRGACYVYYTGYVCRCQHGYSGTRCETDINECSSDPCLNNGTCNDGINLYTCDCLPGWRGVNCAEIDECASSPCQNGGTCYNLTNRYICINESGWHGDICNEESSGDEVTDYLVTIILGVIILLMVVGFIFYKFCHWKNTKKGNDTQNDLIQYTVPNETVEVSTPTTYENLMPVNDLYRPTSPAPQTNNQGHDVTHS